MRKPFRHALVAGVLGTIVLGIAAPAFAHVEKTVGKYKFTVGWGDEPTYAGFRNSVQLILTDAKGNPVKDLGDSLKVTVSFSGSTVSLPLETTFDPDSGEGTPGDYRAWFIPTRPGDYTFSFTGTIHGQKVNESFKSSPTTFDSVKNPSDVEFPSKDPTNGDLATRIVSSESRVGKAADKAKSTASTAIILAIVGLALGVAGVGIGVTGRRKASA